MKLPFINLYSKSDLVRTKIILGSSTVIFPSSLKDDILKALLSVL